MPCSGDGTLRKNPLIWKRWVAASGNMLHSLQLEIACKAVRLLEVGGRLVYSTCSLNPIENEAVVARLLCTFGAGCLRLLDVSEELPALKRRRGIDGWGVWHRGRWHADWESGAWPMTHTDTHTPTRTRAPRPLLACLHARGLRVRARAHSLPRWMALSPSSETAHTQGVRGAASSAGDDDSY